MGKISQIAGNNKSLIKEFEVSLLKLRNLISFRVFFSTAICLLMTFPSHALQCKNLTRPKHNGALKSVIGPEGYLLLEPPYPIPKELWTMIIADGAKMQKFKFWRPPPENERFPRTQEQERIVDEILAHLEPGPVIKMNRSTTPIEILIQYYQQIFLDMVQVITGQPYQLAPGESSSVAINNLPGGSFHRDRASRVEKFQSSVSVVYVPVGVPTWLAPTSKLKLVSSVSPDQIKLSDISPRAPEENFDPTKVHLVIEKKDIHIPEEHHALLILNELKNRESDPFPSQMEALDPLSGTWHASSRFSGDISANSRSLINQRTALDRALFRFTFVLP